MIESAYIIENEGAFWWQLCLPWGDCLLWVDVSGSGSERRNDMPTVYYAGDSTVQTNDIATYPQTGMGQVLSLYLKSEVQVSNHGKNGRSTKSFIAEGRLEPIKARITAGDFLLIQFGHNDENKRNHRICGNREG